tara:strand:- start:56 stop:469 length:414 start_codon:yes stop_codon:yes gene_type:complete
MSVFIKIKGCNMRILKMTLMVCALLLSEAKAGCGGCGSSKTHKSEKKGLLESVPRNNYVEGNVLISCGMCNFMNGDNDCALAIKVGTKVFSVKGVGIDDHGDSHAKDGYCNVIKKVYVEGRVRGKSFTANKMEFPGI